MTARGVKPTPAQLADERAMTIQAATEELVRWDTYEQALLNYLEQALATNPKASDVVKRLLRGNRVEDADHIELYDAVREVAS